MDQPLSNGEETPLIRNPAAALLESKKSAGIRFTPEQIDKFIDTEERKEKGLVPADVEFQVDIYDAVVVSAFSGVHINLAGTESMKLHPFFLLVLCVPLFIVQSSIVMFLRLDQDLDVKIYELDHGDDKWHVKGDILLTMKLVMIVILQLMLFSELIGALKLLVFVVNPFTWSDVRRPRRSEMHIRKGLRWLYSAWVLAPPAILAMIFKLVIAYTVLIDSVSIVLVCDNVKDIIFDSLAIAFIVELDEYFWRMIAVILHLDDFTFFEFKLAPERVGNDIIKSAGFCSQNLKDYAQSANGVLSKLRRTQSGYGRQIELIVTFVGVLFLYSRQLFVIIYALHTNMLPVARDVCTCYRYLVGKAKLMEKTSIAVAFWLKHGLVMDATDTVKQIGEDFCTDETDRMRVPEWEQMLETYPRYVTGGFALLFIFVFLPQLTYVSYDFIKKFLYLPIDAADASEDMSPTTVSEVKSSITYSKVKAGRMKDEIEELKRMMHSLESQVANLCREHA
eukprot:TRINITY_DN11898_c0_g1_i1.p1 TRINITY_DN11898_c0_g1~~TRINITY_DN11898_c0_g1_i1.p1  ORF type:complete len:507 (-),score=75.43 TRINITY_DN11898_c0_g1_i1:475-1995(-)